VATEDFSSSQQPILREAGLQRNNGWSFDAYLYIPPLVFIRGIPSQWSASPAPPIKATVPSIISDFRWFRWFARYSASASPNHLPTRPSQKMYCSIVMERRADSIAWSMAG
jgi:hypothetical protein